MNVLFLINDFDRGGAQRVVTQLLRYLPHPIPDSKFYLYLLEESEICYPLPDSVKIVSGSKLHSSGLYKFLKLSLLSQRLKKFIVKENINTVISFLYRANYVNILSLISGSTHRAIISERNTASIIYAGPGINNLINRFLIRKLYLKCQEIIAVSEGVKKDLEVNFAVPDENIKVIYNPYDIDKIKQEAQDPINHPWFINQKIKTVLSVGRLVFQKNHKLLIEAFRLAADDLPEVRLVIIGSGPEEEHLTQLIQKLEIGTKVELSGQQKNPFAYMARADLFVLPSIAEGFPNVLVEAMICGCPVVSTDCSSGPAEIITNGLNGILVPVNDIIAMSEAIISLLNDEERRSWLVENARKKADEFNLSIIGRHYANLLNK